MPVNSTLKDKVRNIYDSEKSAINYIVKFNSSVEYTKKTKSRFKKSQ